ncbi:MULTISPECIES: response regulator [Vagococcus]|uniref:Transcriptional regulatory protein n=1 Tax=Vagococcus fluvialis bH819 TaxID=1255619 RepID=A0A1X6WLG0_9ENTE|nr:MULTISPECIES: response regulator [Vagococcus]SLM85105.1 Two-component response regulator, malate [Vagococcus fluvialis bH819]HCM88479.1 response regulator [Vagococcus sp.]
MTILIIEDDPMVATLNQQFVENISPKCQIENVRQTKDGLNIIQKEKVRLILLDVYLPEQTGLEFLKELHELGINIPVILITAADDMHTLEEALKHNVIDYLIKPFTFERLKKAFQKFEILDKMTDKKTTTNQQALDAFFNHMPNNKVDSHDEEKLPKGLSRLTFSKVIQGIEKIPQPFSTENLSKEIGLSRISTKKYITFLTEILVLIETMQYQEIGRPITLYRLVDDYEEKVREYL